MQEKSLYERLGGAFAIAAVISHFSDALIENPVVGRGSKNPQLRDWHTNQLDRLLPGGRLIVGGRGLTLGRPRGSGRAEER